MQIKCLIAPCQWSRVPSCLRVHMGGFGFAAVLYSRHSIRHWVGSGFDISLLLCLTSSSPLCYLISLMILHEAIANANLRAVADAFARRPDDVNLLDEQRRSVLFCAIVGFKYVLTLPLLCNCLIPPPGFLDQPRTARSEIPF
jgi:hypothetical protein